MDRETLKCAIDLQASRWVRQYLSGSPIGHTASFPRQTGAACKRRYCHGLPNHSSSSVRRMPHEGTSCRYRGEIASPAQLASDYFGIVYGELPRAGLHCGQE